jgi:hypothetical protein
MCRKRFVPGGGCVEEVSDEFELSHAIASVVVFLARVFLYIMWVWLGKGELGRTSRVMDSSQARAADMFGRGLVAAFVQGSDAPLPLVSPNVSNTHTGEKKRAATFGERGMGAVIDKTFSSSGHPQTVSK